MKKVAIYFSVLVLVAASPLAVAQEKTKDPVEVKSVIPLKVLVLFSEYDGDKKIASLPYTLLLRVGGDRGNYIGSLRIGVRVPISTREKESEITYEDVGTNIDCEARTVVDGQYLLDLRADRSSIYQSPTEPKAEELPRQNRPMLRHYRSSFALLLRDGQTMQGSVATDPVSGHVVKVDVTLNLLK